MSLLLTLALILFSVALVIQGYLAYKQYFAPASESIQDIGRVHDDEAGVTCWVLKTDRSDSIACLPNKEVLPEGLDLGGSHKQ